MNFMEKSKHQVYTDLEYKYINKKNAIWRMEFIEMLVEKYPNDMELGKSVREFINVKEDGNR